MDSYSSLSNPSSCESSSVIAAKEKEKEKKKNKGNGGGKLSTDPQSVAARQRRHRISERFKILQSLVPGGSKMDTVSMLEEAIQYVKFLQNQIWLHHSMIHNITTTTTLNADPTNYNNNCSSSLLINDNDDDDDLHLHLPFEEDNYNYSSWEDEMYGAARRSDHHYYS